MAAHQAPPSLGFSRQEHWSGLAFPSPMHESEKWKWSRSVVSDPQQPDGLQPTRLLHPWDFPGKSTWVGCHCLLRQWFWSPPKIKSDTVSTVSPSISHEVMGSDAMIFVFWMLSFKPTFSLSSFTFMHWRRKCQPTPVFLPGESQGRGSLVGCRLWGRTESDTTEVT